MWLVDWFRVMVVQSAVLCNVPRDVYPVTGVRTKRRHRMTDRQRRQRSACPGGGASYCAEHVCALVPTKRTFHLVALRAPALCQKGIGTPSHILTFLHRCLQKRFSRFQVSNDDSGTFKGHIPEGELQISFSRSSGPGGQNVNKVNSKVEIRFHLETASWIPAVGRERLKTQWGHLVNRRGQLVLECDEQRSQLANTRICLDRLRSLVTEACRPPPPGPDEATQRLHEKRRARASARRVEEKRARSQWRRFKEPSRIL
ncbi:uncharacterized protein LOC119179896 isoform X1 [Rhipicephalus microplus]|uniref:uncharacterized protein LOC119179896 isoform X1 n=1 Tax=Rhipicephalus microplus TaxID=6941 RepID=UPI003F6C8741